MDKSYLSFYLALVLAAGVVPTQAAQRAPIQSPEAGVLCDQYM
jgi:hypothetical protein